MSTRIAELLVGVGMLALSLGLMWNVYSDGLSIGWIDGRGPGAGMWPFWLSLGMALTCVWTLIRWVRGTTAESRSESPYIDPESLGLVLISIVSLTGLIVMVEIVGSYIAISVFLGFYMRVVGRHGWPIVIAFMIGGPIFIYFLFEWQLSKYLPKGLPIFEEGFLWIDDFRWRYLM